jgi:S1-C subfamily serine protease
MSGMTLTLLLAGTIPASPVPAEPLPDPLGWGYLGVRTSIDDELKFGTVDPGTAAARGGLLPGDQVLRIGNLRPRTFSEMANYISSFRPGTELKIEVRRGFETKEVTVRLGVRPLEAGPPPIRDR